MRRSIHLRKNLNKGDIITKDLIKITCPFSGIEPWFLKEIIGKRIKSDLDENAPLKWENLE